MAKAPKSQQDKGKEDKKVNALWRALTRHQRRTLAVAAAVLLVLFFLLEQAGVWDALLGRLGMRPAVTLPAAGTLEVHYLSVGNADAALLMCDGAAMLIDGGDWEDGDALTRYLRSYKVEKLDLVIASHGDADHIGGLLQVVSTFPVDRFLLSFMPEGFEPTTATYLNLLQILADRQIPVVDVSPGTVFSLGGAAVEILGPVAAFEDTNEQSVICRVTHGDNRFLFTGDAGEQEEASLLAAGADLTAQVLKVGHHGSFGSSTAAFLKAVGARYGVISCGENNPYGHPHQAAVNRLKQAGVTLYRTDKNGTVVIVSDGKDLTVQTER